MNYRTSPAFSLAQSPKKTIHEMPSQDYSSPGPIYNTWGQGQKMKSTSQSVGNSKRTQINHWVEHTPSPAQYSPQKHHKQHKVGIPKGDIKEKYNDSPEPGCYNPEMKAIRPKTAHYSMGHKFKSIMDEVNDHPGPADYNAIRASQTLAKSRSNKEVMFGTSSRFNQPLDHPGVGQYQVTSNEWLLKGMGTIGKGEREPITKPKVPGPSEYLKKSCFEENIDRKLGKSMSIKLKGCFEEDPTTEQAFGKYFENQDPKQLNYHRSQQYTIGNTKREIFVNEDAPGPADYNSHTFIRKNNKNTIIPQSRYEPYNELIDVPGPGTYRPNVDNGTKYTIPRAKSAIGFQDHPGVGRYKIVDEAADKKRGPVIPKSARTNFISKNMAGVGDYNISQKQITKGTIGKAERFRENPKTKPGPGDYHLQSIMGYKTKRQ